VVFPAKIFEIYLFTTFAVIKTQLIASSTVYDHYKAINSS